MGDFQEEQCHRLLISQYNSKLLCTGAICRSTTKIFVPLHNESTQNYPCIW